MLSSREIERQYKLIEAAAAAGERCPLNSPLGPIDSTALSPLAREGRILVEISGHNWRQITILTGPHAGKRTLPNPNGHAVYRIIGKTTRWPTREARGEGAPDMTPLARRLELVRP
jgi:hypothetical protein